MLKFTSKETHKRLQINAGLLFSDFNLRDLKRVADVKERINELLSDGENFLGATRDGFVFRSQPVFRRYREDGELFGSVNSTVIRGWDIELSATLAEFAPDILTRFLPNSVIDSQELNMAVLDIRKILLNQYVENLVWIGDLSNGGLIAIELRNAVNVGGISFDARQETENGIKIRFIPHSGEFFDKTKPPFQIYFFGNEESEY
ncbi:MAG: hypothetical protein FWE91_10885 [Defluviitaleaceae bacterium]|nr:hypothetical protein [Defluviitaleaceae bacterium]MCL2835179.1 hypothetical protein [Defluviitaleaceae bacterium]